MFTYFFAGESGWNVSLASYALKSFSVTTQETIPTGLFFKPDGTAMYVVGEVNATVYQYTLSTAWDVSSASYASKSASVSTQETSPEGLFFKDDGTAMYVVGLTNDTVYQYTLSTAWDVSTASYASKSFSVATQATNPVAFFINGDGKIMYVSDNTDKVYQYTIGTAWDISTASYASKSFDATSQNFSMHGCFLNPGSSSMYLLGNVVNSEVYQYTLSTSGDVSTASYTSRNFDVSTQDTQPLDLFFRADGRVMYIIGNTDKVYQYYL